MARTEHINQTGPDRGERRARRQPRPTERRQGTLPAIIAADLADTEN